MTIFKKAVLISALIILFSQSAFALEVGDVFFLGKAAGYTVTNIIQRDREGIDFTAQVLEANAAEYCERYEQLTPMSFQMRQCIKQNIGYQQRYKVICRTATIITDNGSYRPSSNGGPWVSVGNSHWIIQGDGLFNQACRRR